MPTSSSSAPGLLRAEPRDDRRVFTFQAMACPCEIHLRGGSVAQTERLALLAEAEARRIENKFSRYRDDNIIWAINHSKGQPVPLDKETWQLLHYAGECHRMSDGLFDVTSGILRKAWRFDGRKAKPDQAKINSLLKRVGWHRVRLEERSMAMDPGMEIDLGGIGKEYAVDRVAQILAEATPNPVMVNFGGDIRIPQSLTVTSPWIIGVADPDFPDRPAGQIELYEGAVTTSGVSYRHCFVNGKRLGHILDPRTGWPVADAPRCVTVIAGFCLEAGMYSTLAMLQGPRAETFLADSGVTSHCFR